MLCLTNLFKKYVGVLFLILCILLGIFVYLGVKTAVAIAEPRLLHHS